MAKSYICVFDCETIPDVELIRKIYSFDGDDIDVSLQAFEHQKSVSGSEFLPVMFHKVVAVSAVLADEYGKFIKVSTMDGENEREILSKFINFLNTHNPRLVSFNGRGFDLPMMMVRAMRYNIVANAYYESENKELNKDKWKNYRSRYDGQFHLDLLDHISDFGAVRGLKLDTLCAALNLPGKYDIHGDQVLELYYLDKLDKINEYCESDVLNTYWLFLKFELLRGNILKNDYANFLHVMSEFLENERMQRGYTEIFCEYIKAEIERLNDKNGYEKSQKTALKSQNFKPSLHQDESYENLEKIPLSELNNHLAKNGLDGVLSKGVNAKLKSKPKIIVDDDLPEINLDDE